ncbi:GspH/FimT family pseudopilin [Rheinheimera texasensis]|uniref:GspH/FimT family pseudopilin n=1 Tax=Rheinheimera texasensis TaxID=306205 RepID=UPI0032B25AC9
MRAANRSRGFSLIEFMIALIILSILVGIAVPGFLDFLRRQKMSSSANSALAMLQYARSEAIKRQSDIEVNFVADSTGWTIEVRRDDTDELLRTLRKDDTQTEWSGSNRILFDLRGRPAAASCMQLAVDGDSSLNRQISVLSGGKIAVKEGDCI